MATRNREVSIIWHGEEVLKQLKGMGLEKIDEYALEIVTEADPPIDTGFLSASAYVNSASGLNTFDEGWSDGRFMSRHTGGMVERARVNEPEPHPEGGATVGFAADYALWVEEKTSFLYQAAQRVAARTK